MLQVLMSISKPAKQLVFHFPLLLPLSIFRRVILEMDKTCFHVTSKNPLGDDITIEGMQGMIEGFFESSLLRVRRVIEAEMGVGDGAPRPICRDRLGRRGFRKL